MPTPPLRLALIPLNPTVGDLERNADRGFEAIERAMREGGQDPDAGPIDAVVLPELAMSGYPPRDLVLVEGFVERCAEAAFGLAEGVAARWPSLTLIVGLPMRTDRGRGLANSLLAFRGGDVLTQYDKRLLPTYDVFDEDRYFEPGTEPGIVVIRGARVGLAVCEDLWRGIDAGFASRYAHAPDPIAELAETGIDALIVPSASPFVERKHDRHRGILQRAAGVLGVPVVSVNQLGGNDDLVFDGRCRIIAPDGSTLAQSEPFGDDPLIVGLGIEKHEPQTVVSNTPAHGSTPDPIDAGRNGDQGDNCENGENARLVVEALTLGVRDYLGKCGFTSACLGLSGGIDSALTAAIAARAIGAEHIVGVAMPGPFSSMGSVRDAHDLAERLGMRCLTIPIAPGFDGHAEALNLAFDELGEARLGVKLPDVTQENLQSRVRGALMMGLSNRTGAILLTTGNKSELAVGYCTLYGDMNGGLAVLSDVPKTLVYQICGYINAHWESLGYRCPPIPESTINKPPSAELAPDQLDADSLPDYAILDEIVERHVERRQSAAEIIASAESRHAAGFDAQVVARICRLIDLNEYKRRQLAVGLKITSTAFGPGRRMPVAQRFIR